MIRTMAKDSIVPEEKLLKIIENPSTPLKPLPEPASVVKKNSPFDKHRIIAWFVNKRAAYAFNFKTFNKIFMVLCVLVSILWVFNLVKSSTNVAQRLEHINNEAAFLNIDEYKYVASGVAATDLADEMKKRNVFTFVPGKAPASVIGPTDIAQLVANYKLVGIIWSSNPQAMIEDSKEQKTYLLSAGDQIGQFTIHKILQDKAIIGKDGQEWELR